MQTETNDLPPPVNHVFLDFENVQDIDLSIIGKKNVHFTLLLGSRQTKLNVALVEKLLQNAANVELVRLTSSGKNALDFTLAYYVGRAVLADPRGYFHIISGDGGFEPLVEHLRGKHVRARLHEDFSTLTFSAATKPLPATSPVAAPAVKQPEKSKTPASHLEALESRVLNHLRKPTTKRPGTKDKLASDLITHLGKKVTVAEASELIKLLSQAGHLVIDDKGKVTYHLESV